MINLDNNLENSDWIKRSWDLPYKTVEEVISNRAPLHEQVAEVKLFMSLPVYRAAPESFKDSAEKFLAEFDSEAN